MDSSSQVPQVIQAAYVIPVLNAAQSELLNKAKAYALQESTQQVVPKQSILPATQSHIPLVAVGGQSAMMQRQQALVLMCRVYVGSIYYDLREEIVRNAFIPFGPIKSMNMSFDPVTGKHKGFAFVEYETPDAAQLALEQMTTALLAGRSIKVGRPSNMPQSHPIIDQILEESQTEKRIYVGSVHNDLTVNDLKSVFSAFGNILNCSLVPDRLTGKHKGYGWIEYSTLQSARDAISSMNNFDIGGQYLKVGRAIAPPGTSLAIGSSFNTNPYVSSAVAEMQGIAASKLEQKIAKSVSKISSAPMVTNSAIPPPGVTIPKLAPPKSNGVSQITSKPQQIELPNTISSEEDFKVKGTNARHVIMQKLQRTEQESRVMMLLDMVDASEVDETLESEITEECQNFGIVNRVIIYQEKQGEEESAKIIVKIFVEFKNVISSNNAIQALNGRWFGGNKVKASSYSQHKFDRSDYTD